MTENSALNLLYDLRAAQILHELNPTRSNEAARKRLEEKADKLIKEAEQKQILIPF